MLFTILFTLASSLVGATPWSNQEQCENDLTQFRERVLNRLIDGGQLNRPARTHALVKPVTVILATPAITWNLTNDAIATEAPADAVPGALVTKASGDAMIVLYPSADARELLQINGVRADVFHQGVLVGEVGGTATRWRSLVPERMLPPLTGPGGAPETASLYEEPVIAWRQHRPSGRERIVVTEYDGREIEAEDVIELRSGSRVDLAKRHVINRVHRESYLRDHVASAEPSAWRGFMSRYWRSLRHELSRHSLHEMKRGRVSSATINGDTSFEALIGPASQDRCWVIVIDPRSREVVVPNEMGSITFGLGGAMIPFQSARLEDGRVMRPEFLGWSVKADPGGEPSPAEASPPLRSGPSGAVKRTRVLEPAD